jgi:hypothetical protein
MRGDNGVSLDSISLSKVKLASALTMQARLQTSTALVMGLPNISSGEHWGEIVHASLGGFDTKKAVRFSV